MSDAQPAGGPTEAEIESVMRAARVLVGVSAQSFAVVEDRLTLPQLRVLVMVASRGPLRLAAVAEGLGVRGPVQSPTFVIARTHPSLVGGAPLVHVDAYRLGSAAELDDLDIDFARSVVVIEWGRPMASSVADAWWDIELERPVGCVADLADEDLDADAPRFVTIERVEA